MRKKSKFACLVGVFRLLGGFWFLFEVAALVVILIAFLPPQEDWQVYCLALYAPLLLISLSLSVLWAIASGTEFDCRSEKDQNRNKI